MASDPGTLGVGTRIGPYEIVEFRGAGGMGQVYRARDTRLNRDVAMKVVSDALLHDADSIARKPSSLTVFRNWQARTTN